MKKCSILRINENAISSLRGAFLSVSGERLNGIQEVSGSIPLISTNCILGDYFFIKI